MPVERVGVSFEPELLRKFDDLIRSKGYTNRSEAIRDIVREYIMNENLMREEGQGIGTITFIYNHDFSDVTHRLMHIQHEYHLEIYSSTHVHIDKELCLEVLVIRGDIENLKKLAGAISSQKGVKHCRLILLPLSSAKEI